MGFQCTARIRSLMSCAEPEMSSESANAASIPSVAKIRTSPGTDVESRCFSHLATRARGLRSQARDSPSVQGGRVSAQHEPLYVSHAEPGQGAREVGHEGKADHGAPCVPQCVMTAFDERDEVFARLLAHDLAGLTALRGLPRHRALGRRWPRRALQREDGHDPEVAVHRFPAPTARGEAPFDRLAHVLLTHAGDAPREGAGARPAASTSSSSRSCRVSAVDSMSNSSMSRRAPDSPRPRPPLPL